VTVTAKGLAYLCQEPKRILTSAWPPFASAPYTKLCSRVATVMITNKVKIRVDPTIKIAETQKNHLRIQIIPLQREAKIPHTEGIARKLKKDRKINTPATRKVTMRAHMEEITKEMRKDKKIITPPQTNPRRPHMEEIIRKMRIDKKINTRPTRTRTITITDMVVAIKSKKTLILKREMTLTILKVNKKMIQ
jgi:hypothetical protein